MSQVTPTTILSHWNHRFDGLVQSSQEFYAEVERLLSTQNLDELKAERVNLSEGGIFSSKREYLQLRRKDHVFHVCAAPYGNGFFVSWWLGQVESGFFAWLSTLPVIGFFVQNVLRPLTYYRVDTALMFQSIIHSALVEVLDGLSAKKGLRALSEGERKPVMRDFFARLGG